MIIAENYKAELILMTLRFLILSILSLSVSISAYATNGYFRLGFGTNSIAMGGTGTALAQDGLAGAMNPATIFTIDQEYTMALSLFNPKRSFEVSGASFSSAQVGDFALQNGKVESGSELFMIPSLAYKTDLGEDWAISVSLYGNGGMNTDYKASVFYGGDTGVDLVQAFLNTSVAYKLTPTTQLGFSPIVAIQSFEAKGVGSFAPYSQDSAKLSDKDHDTVLGYGARLGVVHQVTSAVHLGASYQTAIDFNRFENYQGLFAEKGDMDIPSTYNLGITYDDALVTVALDYQVINYSEVAAIANPLMPNIQTSTLGSDGGAGFGWKDMSIVKLGFALKNADNSVIRAGLSYGEQPIESSEVLFNILAPGVQEWHYTAGYEFGADTRYSVAFSYSPPKSVKGLNPLYQSQDQYIEIEMEQFELTFAAAF